MESSVHEGLQPSGSCRLALPPGAGAGPLLCAPRGAACLPPTVGIPTMIDRASTRWARFEGHRVPRPCHVLCHRRAGLTRVSSVAACDREQGVYIWFNGSSSTVAKSSNGGGDSPRPPSPHPKSGPRPTTHRSRGASPAGCFHVPRALLYVEAAFERVLAESADDGPGAACGATASACA